MLTAYETQTSCQHGQMFCQFILNQKPVDNDWLSPSVALIDTGFSIVLLLLLNRPQGNYAQL